jgi:hypothetical protein
LDFTKIALKTFGLGEDRIRLFTTEEVAHESLSALGRFAAQTPPFPIRWDGQFPDKVENREIIARDAPCAGPASMSARSMPSSWMTKSTLWSSAT